MTAAGLFEGVLLTGDLGALTGLFLLCEFRLTRPSPDAWRLRLGFSGDLKSHGHFHSLSSLGDLLLDCLKTKLTHDKTYCIYNAI